MNTCTCMFTNFVNQSRESNDPTQSSQTFLSTAHFGGGENRGGGGGGGVKAIPLTKYKFIQISIKMFKWGRGVFLNMEAQHSCKLCINVYVHVQEWMVRFLGLEMADKRVVFCIFSTHGLFWNNSLPPRWRSHEWVEPRCIMCIYKMGN